MNLDHVGNQVAIVAVVVSTVQGSGTKFGPDGSGVIPGAFGIRFRQGPCQSRGIGRVLRMPTVGEFGAAIDRQPGDANQTDGRKSNKDECLSAFFE